MRPVLLVLLAVSACSPLPPNNDGGVDAGVDGGFVTSGWCPLESTETTSDGFTVAVCEQGFTSAPVVHAPEDTAGFVYGGVERDSQGEVVFAGRTQIFPLPLSPMPSWLTRESSSGNVRYGYFIYRARVANGVVEDVVPVARIDERVMQRLLAGKVFEGVASPRISDGGTEVRFAFDMKNVPIRVRLDPMLQATETDRLWGYPRYALLGHIENANNGARAADGGCFAALSSFGPQNPLFGASGDEVMVLRHPDMHGGLDDVFTFDWPAGASGGNNMGVGLFVSTASLLRSSAPALTNGHSSPHGTPWGAPSVDLLAVEGGGAICP